VHVVKGYHAEESEARIFAEGVNRILQNITRSITAGAFMSFCFTSVFGVAGALIMYLGAREVMVHRLDVGSYVEFTMLLAFMVAPIAKLVSVGTQLTEAFAGLDRTAEILNEPEEDCEPERTRVVEPIQGDVAFEDVTFAYILDKPVFHGISFKAKAGTVTALVGSSGSGKSTIISLICGFHAANGGLISIDCMDIGTIRLSSFRQQLGVVLRPSFSRALSARTFSSVVLRPPRNNLWKPAASLVLTSSPSSFLNYTKGLWANAASNSLAASVSGSPSPAPFLPTLVFLSLMKPPVH
jgi:ABC-type bacteriocin/lantibiotic exporter with double-glycine peptidase domain